MISILLMDPLPLFFFFPSKLVFIEVFFMCSMELEQIGKYYGCPMKQTFYSNFTY